MTRLDAGVIVPKRETGRGRRPDLDHAAPCRAGAEGSGRRLDRGARPADPVARLRAGRAGAVQHPRQRRQILAVGRPHRGRGRRADGGGGRVEIVVRDEGPGIDPAALDRLFDKFYRADDGDRRRAGTGLGLAIAKGFVEVQGGTIAARNRGDRSGAEFVVSYLRHDRRRCRHPDRRGRAADPPPAAHDARRAGLSHDRGVDRRRGAGGAAPSPARPRAARSRPARHRRLDADRARSAKRGRCRSSCCRAAATRRPR